jgi:cytochrome c oxidase assembly factor CtaG
LSAPAASSFSFEPVFLVLASAAAIAYARALRGRLRSWRTVVFGLGLLFVVVPLNSPLETVAAHYLLLAHLLQNAVIADWAPPLLILGLTPDLRATIARRGGAAFARVTRLHVALPIWLAAWYGVHLPFFYDFALRHDWALNVEHAVLLAAGLIFWWPILAGEPRRVSTPLALGYLGIAFASSVFLGLAFMFSTSAFYDFYVHAPRLWGLSPARDQNFGGVLMNGEQTLVFLIAIGYFFMRLLDEEHDRNE